MKQTNTVRATIVKHSLSVVGHRASVFLEFAFWEEHKTIARPACSRAPISSE
ncbi:MAG: ribbon-helix-helix domain-containing protein [Methylocella sp.]